MLFYVGKAPSTPPRLAANSSASSATKWACEYYYELVRVGTRPDGPLLHRRRVCPANSVRQGTARMQARLTPGGRPSPVSELSNWINEQLVGQYIGSRTIEEWIGGPWNRDRRNRWLAPFGRIDLSGSVNEPACRPLYVPAGRRFFCWSRDFSCNSGAGFVAALDRMGTTPHLRMFQQEHRRRGGRLRHGIPETGRSCVRSRSGSRMDRDVRRCRRFLGGPPRMPRSDRRW